MTELAVPRRDADQHAVRIVRQLVQRVEPTASDHAVDVAVDAARVCLCRTEPGLRFHERSVTARWVELAVSLLRDESDDSPEAHTHQLLTWLADAQLVRSNADEDVAHDALVRLLRLPRPIDATTFRRVSIGIRRDGYRREKRDQRRIAQLVDDLVLCSADSDPNASADGLGALLIADLRRFGADDEMIDVFSLLVQGFSFPDQARRKGLCGAEATREANRLTQRVRRFGEQHPELASYLQGPEREVG